MKGFSIEKMADGEFAVYLYEKNEYRWSLVSMACWKTAEAVVAYIKRKNAKIELDQFGHEKA